MKYLKLFEYHNKYYSEITEAEFTKKTTGVQYGDVYNSAGDTPIFIKRNWDNFTKDEIKKIMHFFPTTKDVEYHCEINGRCSYNRCGGDKSNELDPYFPNGRMLIFYSPGTFLLDKGTLYDTLIIIKTIDEWYYIHDYTPVINDGQEDFYAADSYYACDQFEGLMHCLRDINTIGRINNLQQISRDFNNS